MASFNIPTGKKGNVWHVFNYDAKTDQVIPVNTFSNSASVRANKENTSVDKTQLMELLEEVKSTINIEENYELEKLIYTGDLIISGKYNEISQEDIDSLISAIEEIYYNF